MITEGVQSTGEVKLIVNILTFNLGRSRGSGFCNGPGNSLLSLLKSLKISKDFKVKVFTFLDTEEVIPGIQISKLEDFEPKDQSEIVHWWSGLTRPFYFKVSKHTNNPYIIGPNLIDGSPGNNITLPKESDIFNLLPSAKYLTLNNQLKFCLSREYKIPLEQICIFKSGPLLNLWEPPEDYRRFILWKGAGNQPVKDLEFAQRVREKLPQYNFLFLGDKERYQYYEHINLAKKAWLYFSTSISETMGMTLLEQWSAGVPSVTHPKIMLHGENYETGIITNRTTEAYCEAISSIMEDDDLRNYLSLGARKYVIENFDNDKIFEQYLEILKNAS
jgi:hypothetical protein